VIAEHLVLLSTVMMSGMIVKCAVPLVDCKVHIVVMDMDRKLPKILSIVHL